MKIRISSLLTSILGLATLGTVALLPQSAMAAGAPAPVPSLRVCDRQGGAIGGPGYYVVTESPGKAATLYALIGNRGHMRGTIAVVPVGATTGTYGSVSVELPSRRPQGVGSWVSLSAKRVVADPGKAAVVPFVLRVPRHTEPGDYLGALTAYVPAHAHRQHGVSLTIQTRVALGILVQVPGPRHSALSATSVFAQRRARTVSVVASVRNSGNTLLKGWGHLWVWKHGRRGTALSVAMSFGMTVPHSGFRYPVNLSGRKPAGTYTYALRLWWQGGVRVQRGTFRVR